MSKHDIRPAGLIVITDGLYLRRYECDKCGEEFDWPKIKARLEARSNRPLDKRECPGRRRRKFAEAATA